MDTIISGGVEIRGVRATAIPYRSPAGDPVLEEYKFVAHRDRARVSLKEAIRLSTHIVLEYHQIIHVKTIELFDELDTVSIEELASPILTEVLGDLPLIQANVFLVASSDQIDGVILSSNINIMDTKKLVNEENVLLVVGIGLLTQNKSDQLQQILPKLRNGGFVLTREKSKLENLSTCLLKYNLDVILEKSTDTENIILLKKREQLVRKTELIYVKNNEFAWLEKLKLIMNMENETTDNTRIILVGDRDYECGLLGFVNCLRKELGGEIIKAVLIQDEKAPKFSLQNSLYSEQLHLDLPINVLQQGKIWGSYRHQPLLPSLKLKQVHHAFVDQVVCNNM